MKLFSYIENRYTEILKFMQQKWKTILFWCNIHLLKYIISETKCLTFDSVFPSQNDKEKATESPMAVLYPLTIFL